MSSYKGRPWSYSIIGAIVLFMIFTLVLVYIMVSQKIDVLYPDYYERTLQYDVVQNRLAEGEKSEYEVSHFFSTNKDSMFLNFPSVEKAEGTIAFIKPDNAKSDLIFPFSADSGQSVALNIKDLQRGAWAIEVEWKSDTVNVLSRFKLTL